MTEARVVVKAERAQIQSNGLARIFENATSNLEGGIEVTGHAWPLHSLPRKNDNTGFHETFRVKGLPVNRLLAEEMS